LQRGFTLVEVLVALLIMAVMAAMGWQGVSGMVRARDIGAAASERTLRLSAVIGQWESDIAAIYDSPVVPGIAFDGAALRLVRRQADGVQVVVWALRDGRWQRWPGPVVQNVVDLRSSWMSSQQLQGQEPEQLTVLEGATDWQVYFWRDQGWSNAQSSGDTVAVLEPSAPPPPPPPASGASAPGTGASTPGGGANAPGGGASAPAPAASGAGVRLRSLLPTGVRLQIDLPEGRILRDVMLTPAG
jgi:general secretion pathway protein J